MKLFRFARICWMVTLTIEFNGLTDALFQTTHTHKHTHTAGARLIDSSIMCGCVCMIDKRYSLQHPRHIQWIILRSYDWMMNIETKTTKNIEILIIFSRCFDSIFFSAPSMNRNHCLYLYTNKFNMKSHNSMADERRRRHNRIFFVFCWWNTKCWITSITHSHNKHLSHNGNCFFCIICLARCCYIYSLLSCEPKMPNANFKWTNNLKKKHKK